MLACRDMDKIQVEVEATNSIIINSLGLYLETKHGN